MITGKAKLLDWYRSQADAYPYWFIAKTTDKQDYIHTCANVVDYSPVSGENDLSHALGLLNPDTRYSICLRDRYDQNNKAHMRSVFFDSEKAEPITQRENLPQIAGINSGDFDQKVNERVFEQFSVFKKDWENDQKIKELEKKIEELKKENNERPNYLEKALETYGKDIFEFLKQGSKKPQLQAIRVSGFDNKQNDMNPTEQEQFEQLMTTWEKADPDYLKVISKIVKLISTNPKKYRMAKSML